MKKYAAPALFYFSIGRKSLHCRVLAISRLDAKGPARRGSGIIQCREDRFSELKGGT